MNIFDLIDFSLHVGLPHCLLLAALLFAIGLFGLITRRNLIAILMSVELMLNAVNINLVAFNHFLPHSDTSGQLLAIFSIVVAAAEVAVGMALAFKIYRARQTIDVESLNTLKG